ncbi:MAG: hypothetical protein ACREDM_10185, partial [Methylocella sp.]
SAHRARKAGAFVETPGRKLRLFFLPPYAAAPVRWRGSISKRPAAWRWPVEDDFPGKVRRSPRDPQNDVQKIISCFQKPSLEYAA